MESKLFETANGSSDASAGCHGPAFWRKSRTFEDLAALGNTETLRPRVRSTEIESEVQTLAFER